MLLSRVSTQTQPIDALTHSLYDYLHSLVIQHRRNRSSIDATITHSCTTTFTRTIAVATLASAAPYQALNTSGAPGTGTRDVTKRVLFL